jgi:hypothetical protein
VRSPRREERADQLHAREAENRESQRPGKSCLRMLPGVETAAADVEKRRKPTLVLVPPTEAQGAVSPGI